MAPSAEWIKMQAELKMSVIPELRRAGFKGTFPNLQRLRDGKAELIGFLSHSRSGGAFEVGASIIFIDAADDRQSNWFSPEFKTDISKLTFYHGRIRSGLPGVIEGAFFYVDTYVRHYEWTDPRTQKHYSGSHYEALTESFKNPTNLMSLTANKFELVQKADEGIYTRIAAEVNKQMRDLLIWFDSIKSFDDLQIWNKNRAKPGIFRGDAEGDMQS